MVISYAVTSIPYCDSISAVIIMDSVVAVGDVAYRGFVISLYSLPSDQALDLTMTHIFPFEKKIL